MLENNLVIFQVIVPLLFAMVCCLFSSHRLSWLLSFVVSLFSFANSILLLLKTYEGQLIVYNLGGWAAPYGIEIKVDLLSSTILTLISFIAAISLVYGFYSNRKEIATYKISNFYSIFLLSLGSLNGILISNDVFNIYVFLEILSISSYILVAMGRNRTALVASFEYLIIGTVGATFYLIGIGFLYSITGTLNISDLALCIQDLHNNKTIQVGALFIIVGLSIKVALFPFHGWLIKVYSQSLNFISVFFSGTTTKVMIYLIIRIIYGVFGVNFAFTVFPFSFLFIALSFCAIIFSSIAAILSDNIKKIFAYSSISQIGYIILAIALNSRIGIAAAIIHVINHSIIKSGLFMVSGCVSYCYGSTMLSNFAGLSRTMPYVAAAFVLLSLSLVGVPMTAGFVTKWYLLKTIFTNQIWYAAFILLAGSIFSVIYTWKVVEVMYFKLSDINENKEDSLEKPPLSMIICTITMALMSIIFGIYCLPITKIAEKISNVLLH